jgi:hypothetical protein
MIDFINSKRTLIIILLAASFSDGFMLAVRPFRAVSPLYISHDGTPSREEVFKKIHVHKIETKESINEQINKLRESIQEATDEFDESIADLDDFGQEETYELRKVVHKTANRFMKGITDDSEKLTVFMDELYDYIKGKFSKLADLVESTDDKMDEVDDSFDVEMSELQKSIMKQTNQLSDSAAQIEVLLDCITNTIDNTDIVKNETNGNKDLIAKLKKKFEFTKNIDDKNSVKNATNGNKDLIAKLKKKLDFLKDGDNKS